MKAFGCAYHRCCMHGEDYLVAGLGELLWDVFPDGKRIGGAPANFAYSATVLGNHGIVASRVGQDELGAEAIRELESRSVDCSYLQRDLEHPTGTVQVTLDSEGHPTFNILRPVAWDCLAWTPEWRKLAQNVDAVCFGSLAQRAAASRETIQEFVKNTLPDAVRVFDANLRPPDYSAELLTASCEMADIVKMNEQELPDILELLGLPRLETVASVRGLAEAYGLKVVCITRGSQGSLLVAKNASHSHPGIEVTVADTVGAGDAFTAGLVHEYLRMGVGQASLGEDSLAAMNLTANRMGAWVASRPGGMPEMRSQDAIFFN